MNAIGNTPLIKLERLSEPGFADIYVKYEGGNPTGSMKDRMALEMIEGAEKRNELKPGGTVVDYTGGSTGSSLAGINKSNFNKIIVVQFLMNKYIVNNIDKYLNSMNGLTLSVHQLKSKIII